MKVGLVVPHIFMQQRLLPHVIFSPGVLALELAEGLQTLGVDVTIFSPGPVTTSARNVTADLRLFEQELAGRGDDYIDLLKKHPFTFITLARQVQSELIAQAYAAANTGELDIVHIYTNEEDTALPFAQLCQKPVVFTHHDPFNFLVRYKSLFPKYPYLNWLSISMSQRAAMPANTNWVGNIYHGFPRDTFAPNLERRGEYLVYLGRITQAKGAHLAIQAVRAHNRAHPEHRYQLRIAGKHYAGHHKDVYWHEQIEPLIDGDEVRYVGFISDINAKHDLLAGADAMLVPSTFAEPFGMVMLEAMACGTPVIGLDSGAIPEVVRDGTTGFVVTKDNAVTHLAEAIAHITAIDRAACRQEFETRFTTERMCQEHLDVYRRLTESPDQS